MSARIYHLFHLTQFYDRVIVKNLSIKVCVNMDNKSSVKEIVGFTVFIIIILSFVIGIFFLGFAGAFDLLGVRYDSYLYLFLFVLSYFILGVILDIIAIGFIKLSTFYITGKVAQFLTRMTIDCSFNWLAIYTVDEFMTSISIPLHVEIIVVVVLFFMEVVFDEKKQKPDSR